MIEEISEYGNLRKLEHKLLCPDCRIEMVMGNTVYMTNPPLYPYECPQCGMHTSVRQIYPYTEIVGEPICTYQQEKN